MGKIVLLDELTINQIAAGEVIERPASVVKEMLENSIDAGAKNITIEVKNGGISLIRITDDGSGISEDDMEIAFERHATSKIRSASDLQTVKTMGFRGEALASISAIANVEMVSKTESDTVGHRIVVEGGKVLEKTEVGCATGTRITVQNLFFNTPVRYKFLKKDYTEAGYIEDIVTRIALVNKGVAIKLINNDKVLLQTTGSLDTKNMIYSIYGKDVANGIKEVEYTYEDIKVSGVVGLPEIARSNRSNQLFFVNGRFVRDKSLTAGIEQAYKNLIPSGKYAFAVLNLEMNPNEVDVNVHPAKLEVRFQDEQKVFKAVYNTVKYALDGIVIETGTTNNYSFNDIKIDEQKAEPKEKEIASNNEEMSVEEDKKGFGGLFKKFKKDVDEADDEEKNNTLLDIFNERKLGQGLSKPIEFFTNKDSEKEETKDEVKEEINEEIKEENIEKAEEVEKVSNDKVEENLQESAEQEVQEIAQELVQTVNEESAQEPVQEPAKEQTLAEKLMIANGDIADKEVEFGNTLVSSNTRELDFDVIEALKDKTLELDSVVKVEKQETVVIPTTRQIVSAETQTIESVNGLNKENELFVSDEDKSEEPKIENTGVDNDNSENEEDKIEERKLESTVPSLDAVEKITSKILEMKMKSLENTQMIDTSKVREALLESQKITPEFANMYKKTFGLEANEIRKEKQLEELEREKINVSSEFLKAENDSLFEKEPEISSRINYKFVGIAFENYIIIEYKNEMYIIDEMSARERITLEKVKALYYSNQNDSTTLLLPDIVTCSFREMSIARENVELFKKAGFDFEEFGENTLKLTAVPAMCEELNTKTLFLNILNEIGNVAVNDIEEKETKFIRAIAINSTTRPKLKLDEKEVDKLVQELLSLKEPFSAPQGKSTALKMSRGDIEKKFARRK